MFRFKNKTIIILSPEKWGKMHISKHHYAIELAQKGNMVYFITHNRNIKGITSIKSGYENLTVIEYSTFFPYSLKFHFRVLFDFLMKFQIKKLLKKIAKPIDVVWCFDRNIYSNLNYFNADTKIYHPVDPVTIDYQIEIAKSADIIFSVSERILSTFDKIKKAKHFINHGLSEDFQSLALKNITEHSPISKIQVGYFGNLLRPILDSSILKTIISENKNINFIFWGSYENYQSNIGGSKDEEVIKFINFLKNQDNVALKGSKSKKELVQEIYDEKIDAFILMYKFALGSDRSNAHKLIEYLATGKVIVANLFSTYKNFNDLIVMPKNDDDSAIHNLFNKVINNLVYYNNTELQQKRIDYALNNTYAKQIKRIEKIITLENKNKFLIN